MAKLSTRKSNKNRSGAASSQLSASKSRPNKKLKNGIKKDIPLKKAIKKDSLLKKAIKKDAPLKKAIKKDTPSEKAVKKDTPSKNGIKRATPLKKSIKKDTPSKNGIKKDTPSKNGIKKDTHLKKGIKKDTPLKKAHKKDTPSKKAIKKDTPSKKAIKKDTPSKKGIKKAAPSGSASHPTKNIVSQTKQTPVKKEGNKRRPRLKTRSKKTRGAKGRPVLARKRELVVRHFMKGSNKDKKLMKKFANNEKLAPKNKVTKMDPAQLVNLELVQAAISGLRKLPTVGKIERKSLHDITDEDEHFVYLQVTLCKVSKVTDDFHLTGPTTVSVYLPNSLVTDSTDVILITKDLQRGIKKDHQNSLNYFKELLHVKGASSLISEIIPLRQLKLEYREFEAKRLLANRTDMLLCDDTIMRFIPKFLTKYFYVKKRLPVQVNLKAIDLQKEIQRALSVSKLFFSMKGNSSLMKIGRMGQTDEEIQQNVLAAVAKLASHAPGEWANIQSLSLKLERTSSIPIYANMNSLNKVKSVAPKQLFPGKPVSGTLTTVPGKCITVFPDGSVTVTSLRKNKSRLAKENETNEIEKKVDKSKSKGGKKNKERKKSAKSKSKVELPETETEVSTTKKEAGEKKTKRKMTEKKSSKAKKQKKVDGSDADSDLESEEDDLEKQEMLYLKQLNQEKESAGGQEKDEDSEEDVWADSDSDSNMEDSE